MGKEAQPQEAQSRGEKKPLVVRPPSNPAEAFVVDAADFASGKVTPFVDLDTEEGTCVPVSTECGACVFECMCVDVRVCFTHIHPCTYVLRRYRSWQCYRNVHHYPRFRRLN